MVGVGYRESGVDFGLASSAGVERIGGSLGEFSPAILPRAVKRLPNQPERELLPARAPTFIPSTFHSHQPS
jgi:hypothetical protein